MHGIAKYASMCSWVFHMKVPTRSPGSIPSSVKRDGETIGPGRDLGERGVTAFLTLEGDDLTLPVDGAAVAEDHADGQWEVLHRRLHHRAVLPGRAT